MRRHIITTTYILPLVLKPSAIATSCNNRVIIRILYIIYFLSSSIFNLKSVIQIPSKMNPATAG